MVDKYDSGVINKLAAGFAVVVLVIMSSTTTTASAVLGGVVCTPTGELVQEIETMLKEDLIELYLIGGGVVLGLVIVGNLVSNVLTRMLCGDQQ